MGGRLLLLAWAALAAAAAWYYCYKYSSLPPPISSTSVGRRGGGAGAGTKRPYTPLAVVMEEAWVAHHARAMDPGPDGEGEWELRYVAVLARHGARYPTKRKLLLALEAAKRVCSRTLSSSSNENSGIRAWCEGTVTALEGAEPASMAPLGWAEHRLLGEEVARAYLTSSSPSSPASVSLRAHVTSKARTRASCRAFRDGAASLWPEALSSLACDDDGARAEGLLRPYASCARLLAHRAAVLLEEEEGGGQVDGGLMERARAAVARGLGLPPAAVDDALVLGLSYACQTDLTLLAPLEEAEEAGMRAHMDWIEGTPHLGGQHASFFSACALLPPELLEEMERREDRENYLMRGFGLPASREVMAPFLRHVTARMEEAASKGKGREVEVFFAHDTTLLPTVALLDLLRLDGADGGRRSGAARAVPYASRLVLEAWRRRRRRTKQSMEEEEGDGGEIERIWLGYNGRAIATLEGGLGEWRARYAAALSVRHEDVCALASGAAEEL